MAKLILWGQTALEAYNHMPAIPTADAFLAIADEPQLAPSTAALNYLATHMPYLSTPYQVMVDSRAGKRSRLDARCHLAPESLRRSSYVRLIPGVYAPPPETALIQASWNHNQETVTFLGSLLCGAFYSSAQSRTIEARPPAATRGTLTASCTLHVDIRGASTVKRALPHLFENAASPREASLALLLSLPHRQGGYHLPRPRLNYTIELTGRSRKLTDKGSYIADLCWPERKLVMEYDSDERHLTSENLKADAVKRMALQEMGYTVITVGRLQLNSVSEMQRIARVGTRALGGRWRFRVRDFERRHLALREALSLPAIP